MSSKTLVSVFLSSQGLQNFALLCHGASVAVSINGCLTLEKVRECTALMSYWPTLSQPSLSMHHPIRLEFYTTFIKNTYHPLCIPMSDISIQSITPFWFIAMLGRGIFVKHTDPATMYQMTGICTTQSYSSLHGKTRDPTNVKWINISYEVRQNHSYSWQLLVLTKRLFWVMDPFSLCLHQRFSFFRHSGMPP